MRSQKSVLIHLKIPIRVNLWIKTSHLLPRHVSDFLKSRLKFSGATSEILTLLYYLCRGNNKTQPTMNYSTKKELAMAYCPDIDYTAALKKLNQWIRTNAELSARLAATGYIPTQRRFTPQQVRLLYHYLGEPF